MVFWRLLYIWRWRFDAACIFVVSKDLCGIGIFCLGVIHVHTWSSGLDLCLRASCGTVQVCVPIGFSMDGWPSGRRGVLDKLSGGGTAAATIYREDSSSLSRSRCIFARMTCITRLFCLKFLFVCLFVIFASMPACRLGPSHSFA